jgi:hemolysin activation/secretion protein
MNIFASHHGWPRQLAQSLVLGVFVNFISGELANAQAPAGLPGAVEAGRDRPAAQAPAQPSFNFSIAPAPSSPIPAAADAIQFLLNDIVVSGANAIPIERLAALYAEMIGTNVTLADIREIASRIEEEYRVAGYLLVRALVPPQSVADGVFTINVVEGFVANVLVEGGDDGTQQRIRDYLRPVLAARPLAIVTLERALLLANDLPGVSVNALLRPSPGTPGAADVVVSVEQRNFTGGLSLDNRGSHFSGLWTLSADFSSSSILSDGDQITGRITTTSPVRRRIAGDLRYYRPLGSDGLVASIIGIVTHGEPGSSLTPLEIVSDSWAVGPRLSYPLIRTRAETLIVDGGFTVQDARLQLLSAQQNHDEWRVIDIGATYLKSGFLGGGLSASLNIAQGVPIFGATSSGSANWSRAGAAPDFTKVTGGVRYVAPLGGAFSVAITGQGQYSFARLMAGEQIAFGGVQLGRGYDPAAIAGDHGLGGSFELRYNFALNQAIIQMIQPYSFFDAAQVWNRAPAITAEEGMTSTGAGIRVQFVNNIIWNVEIARTLNNVPGSDSGRRATKVLTDVAIRF